MTTKLRAHLEGNVVILDDPLPPNAGPDVFVLIDDGQPAPSADEVIQSESGFAREVLLSKSEDIWEND
jgi:hypothetical protein